MIIFSSGKLYKVIFPSGNCTWLFSQAANCTIGYFPKRQLYMVIFSSGNCTRLFSQVAIVQGYFFLVFQSVLAAAIFSQFSLPQRECSRKMKGGIGLRRKCSIVIATYLNSICFVYQEKFVKNDPVSD